MTESFDIVINGAGMVGASLAIALGTVGYRVLLVESRSLAALRPQADYGLRVSAFTPHSQRWLTDQQAWAAVEQSQRVCPFLQMEVWDAAGTSDLHLDDAQGQPMGYIVDNAVVQGALLDQLVHHPQITVLENTTLQDFQRGDGFVQLSDGRGCSFQASLLIGADGAHSQVRDWAGIPCVSWSYEQKTIVGQVHPEFPHQQTCWQRFLPQGPVALLPLADGRCSLAWHTSPEEAEALLQLDSEAFSLALSEAFSFRFGRIQVAGELAAYPLRLNHARQYTQAQIALVGDAAHVIHPLAGLGVNLGFLDAHALAEQLILARRQNMRAIGDSDFLKRYERKRKIHNLAVMGAMDFFKRSSTSTIRPVQWMRNIALNVTDKCPPLKQFAVRVGTGSFC